MPCQPQFVEVRMRVALGADLQAIHSGLECPHSMEDPAHDAVFSLARRAKTYCGWGSRRRHCVRVTFSALTGPLYLEDVAIVMESKYAALNVGDLVRGARAGDIHSYQEIVRRFRASAFGQACSGLGSRHLAEDAVQDAFVEAHLRLESIAVPEAFPGWFREVVVTAYRPRR